MCKSHSLYLVRNIVHSALLSNPAVKKLDLDFKSNKNYYKLILYNNNNKNSSLSYLQDQYILWFIFLFLSLSNSKSQISFPSTFQPFSLDCAGKKSPIILTKVYVVFNRLDPGYVCLSVGIHGENNFQNCMSWCVEPNHEQDSLCIFIKTRKHHQSLTVFHP